MKQAGMQIWMLTGDKVETACCIAVSAGFKNPRQDFFIIKETNTIDDAFKKLVEFEEVSR